jgi:SAM-dependent methyltransferase
MRQQSCRSCGAIELFEILDLGFAPPSNALLNKEELSKGEIHYPLVLLFCQECKLVQTRDFHSGEALFTPDYPYLSSTYVTWIKHSHELVASVIKEFNLDSNSIVAEIASNDGYLLELLSQQGIPAYGIEPTKLAADISVSRGHEVYNCFLNLSTASHIKRERGSANVVIANNVFAHVPELRDFTEAAKLLLSEDGVLVIEVQYFASLLEKNLFDTIYHEHYSYFTITSLANLLKKVGLSIFKVQRIATHGGSIRVYAKKYSGGSNSEEILSSFLSLEEGIMSLDNLMTFQESVNRVKTDIRTFFSQQLAQGKVNIGLGAPAKGNTLINFTGLDREDISLVLDSAESKHGKFLPGSHIPIYPLERQYLAHADNLIILPWNLSDEFYSIVRNFQDAKDIPMYVLLPTIQKIGPKH